MVMVMITVPFSRTTQQLKQQAVGARGTMDLSCIGQAAGDLPCFDMVPNCFCSVSNDRYLLTFLHFFLATDIVSRLTV